MDFSRLNGLSELEIFRIVAPEFDEIPDDVIEKKMLFASIFIDRDCYGDAYNTAIALLTAHLLALPGDIGSNDHSTSTSRVTSRKEGDLSIGYGAISTSDSSWLGQSTYGQMLDQMQRSMGMNLVFMTRGPVDPFAVDDWKFQ